jgi:hypothetical protein
MPRVESALVFRYLQAPGSAFANIWLLQICEHGNAQLASLTFSSVMMYYGPIGARSVS